MHERPAPPAEPGGGTGMATVLTVGLTAEATPLDDLLAAAAHRVVRARTAQEALVQARGAPPDLVVVDARVSPRAASDLVARLRAEPATARTPVLLLDPSMLAPAQLSAIARLAACASPTTGGGRAVPGDEESRLQSAALEAAANAIVITDRDGRITWANPAFTRLTGWRLDEVRGRNPRFLKSGRHEPVLYEGLWRTILSGQVWQGEMVNRRKDGSLYHEEMTITPVRAAGSGEVTHFVAVKVDASERRAVERQLAQAQKMEAVGQLAGGVAHDFSNVLSVIGGYAELALARSDAKSPLRPYLEEVRRAADHGSRLVRQLLEFGRGRNVEPGVLDVDDVVRGIEGMLRRLIPENLEIVISARASPGHVRAERGELEQVIVNLAVNARDAMPRGGRLVIETARAELDEAYCRAHVGARPGPHVVLSVSDTGIGMAPEVQARIFDPFFTTKEAGRGTGLGLATVYGIVRRAGGSIWVYSEPGRGAVFKVYWPSAHEEAPAAGTAAGAGALPGVAPGGTETILLVEDEEALRALARELLESLGYTVLEARHEGEALELSASHAGAIDLLMTDLVMPSVEGRELARRIAAAHPETRVLFVSGYSREGEPVAALPARHAFLQKPYTAAALGTSIRRLLDGD
jgi:two-component system cell cycle sensor histidine kinase/response regulator CckA